MSYDLGVTIRDWPQDIDARVAAELRRTGIEITGPADLELKTGTGWLPLTVQIAETSPVPHASEFRALGAFESGFERSGGPERVAFTAKSTEGNAVAVWFAAALAAVTGGTLDDPQAGLTATGTRLTEVLATLMRDPYFARSFTGPERMGLLGQTAKAKAKEAKAKAARAKPKAHAKPAVAADPSKPVREYDAAARYEPGERLEHPRFGTGIVEHGEPGKVTVWFADARRVLVQAKAAGGGLARPSNKPL